MADVVNIYNRHGNQQNTKKKKNSKIEHTYLTKFKNNGYFLITTRTYFNTNDKFLLAIKVSGKVCNFLLKYFFE